MARERFAAAWGLLRSWDIAANLGIVEGKLHDEAAGAEHLSFALAMLPPSEPEKTRVALSRELATVTAKVARVSVKSEVGGATVTVAGHARVTPLAEGVFVTPGSVLVEVSKVGFDTASRRVEATAGAEVTVVLRRWSADLGGARWRRRERRSGWRGWGRDRGRGERWRSSRWTRCARHAGSRALPGAGAR
ncbi:MAG: PEGA domain-containing protein [Polyangiaceae bacterium]